MRQSALQRATGDVAAECRQQCVHTHAAQVRANGFGDVVEFRLRMSFWHEKSRNMARNVIIAPINLARKKIVLAR